MFLINAVRCGASVTGAQIEWVCTCGLHVDRRFCCVFCSVCAIVIPIRFIGKCNVHVSMFFVFLLHSLSVSNWFVNSFVYDFGMKLQSLHLPFSSEQRALSTCVCAYQRNNFVYSSHDTWTIKDFDWSQSMGVVKLCFLSTVIYSNILQATIYCPSITFIVHNTFAHRTPQSYQRPNFNCFYRSLNSNW